MSTFSSSLRDTESATTGRVVEAEDVSINTRTGIMYSKGGVDIRSGGGLVIGSHVVDRCVGQSGNCVICCLIRATGGPSCRLRSITVSSGCGINIQTFVPNVKRLCGDSGTGKCSFVTLRSLSITKVILYRDRHSVGVEGTGRRPGFTGRCRGETRR